MRVLRSFYVICRIEKGEFRLSSDTLHSGMGSFITKLFQVDELPHNLDPKQKGYIIQAYFSCLKHLFLEIDQRGSGATIIFVPDASIENAKSKATFPWCEFTNLEIMKTLFDRSVSMCLSGQAYLVLKEEERLMQRLGHLAKLASLDGALLLSTRFEMLGFGVKLDAPKYTQNVYDCTSGWIDPKVQFDFNVWGHVITRH